jgi:hypothetical protein
VLLVTEPLLLVLGLLPAVFVCRRNKAKLVPLCSKEVFRTLAEVCGGAGGPGERGRVFG